MARITDQPDNASGVARVNKHPSLHYVVSSKLIHLQLRSDWSPFMSGCNIIDSDNSKPNIIVSLVTDVVLLLTMLIGLFRMRGHVDGKFGLGLLLWKQVR